MSYAKELYRAFSEKNEWKFTEALEILGANPNSYPDEKKGTNFEIILETPGTASFLTKCIEFGANFNVVILIVLFYYIIE